MEIATATVAITTTGGAGVSAGTAKTPALFGYLLDIYFDFDASAPATTDTTVAYAGGAVGNILVLTNVNIDGTYMPLKAAHDAAGAASGIFGRHPLNGPLSVSVAQCNDLAPAVTVTIRYLRI